MLNKNIEHDLIREVRNNLIKSMQTKAEKLLNPNNYHLSSEAKKKLRWLYMLYYEKQGNVTQTANKDGISRQWLSEIKSVFEYNNCDPKSLEPSSKTPHDTSKRRRISLYNVSLTNTYTFTEELTLVIFKKHQGFSGQKTKRVRKNHLQG